MANPDDFCEDGGGHPDWGFSREICWCGSAHYFCTECGAQSEACRP